MPINIVMAMRMIILNEFGPFLYVLETIHTVFQWCVKNTARLLVG